VEDAEIGEEVRGGGVFFGCCDGGDDLDGLGDAKTENLDFWEGAKEAGPCVWVAEEAGPVVHVCAGEGELRQVRNVDAEGRGESDADAAVGRRGRGRAEGVEGAAVEADGEEGFVRAAAVEDDVVPGGFAGCEVGRFEVELGYGAEGVERALARGRVEGLGGVFCWVEEEDEASVVEVGRDEVLEEFDGSHQVVEHPYLEPMELFELEKRDGLAGLGLKGVRD